MLSTIKTKTALTFFFGIVAATFQVAYAGDNTKQIKKNTPSTEFHLPAGLTEADYKANTIILKLKPEYRTIATANSINDPRLIAVFDELQAQNLGKIYPHHAPPSMAKNAYGYPLVDLSLIYELNYTAQLPLEIAINKLIATGMLQYAEPHYIQYEHEAISVKDIEKMMAPYNPNDPDIGTFSTNMYYIAQIKCPEAWGVNTTTARGDSSTVIGIVDSGTDIDHPDLKSKIHYNYKDPINGVDDDNDGYIDNFRGWDVSEKDNNPNVDNSLHGSHVSGCAAAATDNNVGVASPGFRCTFLPVKCAKQSSTTQIDNGYEGITYAADHGCHIINCSWGGPGGGQYALDVITYATINKNVLVVASAGNANNELSNFPGAFDLVLCVASTTNTDAKSSFSTYGHFVDVCSPGSNIRSTVYDNSYTNMSGTSMASPICAGAAAIVKTFYPSYNGLQVGEQLRRTADDIYSVTGNSTYKEKLGTGRINLYRALTESSPSVRMKPLNITDKNDEVYVVNDTLYITGTIIDYLAPVSSLTATLSTANANVAVVNATLTPGAMATLGTFAVTDANAYKVYIKPGTPLNTVIPFTITFKDGTYIDYQYFDVTVNVDYINIAVNDIATTNTSRGRIGWNNGDGTGGLGFAYKDSAMIYEAGLMIGTSSTKVSDNVRGSSTASNDLDFVGVATVKDIIPAVKAEYETGGIFNDNGATSKIGVQVRHKSYAWTTVGNRKFIIFEYSIKNTSGATLSNLYAGIFADWDITDKTSGNNKAATDPANKLGYVYSTVGSKLYGGTRLLTKGPFVHYAIDNVSGGAGGVDIQDQTNYYSTAEKYTTLSTNRLTAGGTGAGNDVLNVVSSGPFTINANDSVKVAFALIAGDDLNDLTNSSINAQIKYDNVVTNIQPNEKTAFSLKQNFPNPVNASKTAIEFYLPASTTASLTIYNAMGQNVMTVFDTQLSEGSHQWNVDLTNFKSGVYFYELKAGNNQQVMKMVVQTKEN
jgi:serine protease